MIIYFIILVSVLLISFLNSLFCDKKVTSFTYFFIATILIFFSGFRDGVGVDYYSYYKHISEISPSIDIGFYGVSWLINYLNFKPQLVFFLFSFGTITLMLLFIHSNSISPSLSIILYFTLGVFYIGSFNLVKQSFSIALFAFSIRYIINKKFLKYTATIIFAALFHLSAIFLIPFYFIANKRFYWGNYLLLFAVIIVFIHYFLPEIALYTKYNIYIGDISRVNNINNSFLIASYTIMSFFFIFTNQKTDYLFVNMIFVSLILIIISSYTVLPQGLVFRFNNYFIISLLILIPNFISLIRGNYAKYLIKLIVIVSCIMYFTYLILINGEKYKLTPYNFNFHLI